MTYKIVFKTLFLLALSGSVFGATRENPALRKMLHDVSQAELHVLTHELGGNIGAINEAVREARASIDQNGVAAIKAESSSAIKQAIQNYIIAGSAYFDSLPARSRADEERSRALRAEFDGKVKALMLERNTN